MTQLPDSFSIARCRCTIFYETIMYSFLQSSAMYAKPLAQRSDCNEATRLPFTSMSVGSDGAPIFL